MSGKFSHFESSSSDSEDSGDEHLLRSYSTSSSESSNGEPEAEGENSGMLADNSTGQDDIAAVHDERDCESRLSPSPQLGDVVQHDPEGGADNTCLNTVQCDGVQGDNDSKNVEGTDTSQEHRSKSPAPKDSRTDRSLIEWHNASVECAKTAVSTRHVAVDRLEARRRKFESNVPIQPGTRKIVLLKGLRSSDECDVDVSGLVEREKGWARHGCSPERSPPAMRSVLSVVRVSSGDEARSRDIALLDDGRKKQRSMGRTVEIVEDEEPLYLGGSDRKSVPVHLRLGRSSPVLLKRKNKRKRSSREAGGSKRDKLSSTSVDPSRHHASHKERHRHKRRKHDSAGSS